MVKGNERMRVSDASRMLESKKSDLRLDPGARMKMRSEDFS